jgi:hypothetical protein
MKDNNPPVYIERRQLLLLNIMIRVLISTTTDQNTLDAAKSCTSRIHPIRGFCLSPSTSSNKNRIFSVFLYGLNIENTTKKFCVDHRLPRDSALTLTLAGPMMLVEVIAMWVGISSGSSPLPVCFTGTSVTQGAASLLVGSSIVNFAPATDRV